VVFTTTKGQLNPSTATTDASGVANATLSTSQEATVTANAAGKTATATVTISPRTGIGVTPPTGILSAGVSTTFTVNVAATANISNVVLNFGDNTGARNLGPISGSTTVPHTFASEGTYTVTATASDAAGCSETISTAVTILPGQPPSVLISASDSTPAVGQEITFTATVSGNTSTIVGYDWNFGSGALPPTATTTGNQQKVTFAQVGTYTITVIVRQGGGAAQGQGQTAVVVGTTLTIGKKP
jgi:PKD repeat protein